MTPKMDDEDLFLLPLYTRYAGIMYSLFWRLTQDSQMAESLLLSVFINARQELRSFRNTKSSEIGWLFCFARAELLKAGLDPSVLSSAASIVQILNRPLPECAAERNDQ